MADLAGLLARTPAPAAFERLAGGLRVLAYHGVPDRAAFAAHLDLLEDRYVVVDHHDVAAAVHQRRPLPDRAVLITFDDGDPTVVDHALPELVARGLPAVLYVVADLVDDDVPFWWDEVSALDPAGGTELVRALKLVPDPERRRRIAALREGAEPVRRRQLTTAELRSAAAAGIVIGNHTASHPCLDRCDDVTVAEELERAHARLSEILGEAPVTFAYPNGNLDERAEPVLTRLGYRTGFLFDHHRQPMPPAHHLRLSRLRVNADAPPEVARVMISGAHAAVHHRVPGRS